MAQCDVCARVDAVRFRYGTLDLCEACVRQECIRESPPIGERPWLKPGFRPTQMQAERISPNNDFAA